jgi:hypothetical protein
VYAVGMRAGVDGPIPVRGTAVEWKMGMIWVS